MDRQRTTERDAPPRRSEARPSTAALVDLLASGDHNAVRPLLEEFVPDLGRLAAALEGGDDDHRPVARTALDTAVGRVLDDPAGDDVLADGGPWDPVGFASVALLELLRELGRPARIEAAGMRMLTLQERTVLLLVEVEWLDVDEAAALLHAPDADVRAYLRSMRDAMGLTEMPESPCAAWTRVRPTRDDTDEETDDHLRSCEPCGDAADELWSRHDRLHRRLPGIGWTQLGRAWARTRPAA